MPRPRISLSDLAPPDVEVEFQGVIYLLPGEVPLSTIVEAVHLQEQLETAKTTGEQTQALERMYRTVMDLFKDRNPDVPDLRLTMTEVGWLIAFVASGGEMKDLEEAVAEVVRDREAAAGTAGRARPTRAKTAKAKTPASRSRSRTRS